MLATLLFTILAPPMDEGTDRGLEHLQGKWELVEKTLYGRKERPQEFEGTIYTIEKDALIITRGTNEVVYQLELGAGKDPKWIDWLGIKGGLKGRTSPGIYKIEGDTLTICLAAPNRDRPTEFVSEQKKSTNLYVLKRVKPEK